MKKKLWITVLPSFLLLPALWAHAQDTRNNEPAFYIGAGYGGFKSRGGEFDDEKDLVEGVVGFRPIPYFAIEANYIDFGEYGGRVAKSEVDGYGAALVGRLPISDSFALYAKGGQFFWDADVKALGIKRSYDGDEPFYGVGAEFAVNDWLGFNLEYSRYEVELDTDEIGPTLDNEETDIDTVKLGIRATF